MNGSEINDEQAKKMLGNFLLVIDEGEPEVLCPRKLDLAIAAIEARNDELIGRQLVLIRYTERQVSPGNAMLHPIVVARGGVTEVIDTLKSRKMTKEQAAGAINMVLQELSENSDLQSLFYVAVFDDGEPACTGTVLQSYGCTEQHFSMLINAASGQIEQLEGVLSRRMNLKKQGEKSLLVPGDAGFAAPLKIVEGRKRR